MVQHLANQPARLLITHNGSWRDADLAGWAWTAPFVSACEDVRDEVRAASVRAGTPWDGADYEAIAADWSFLPLWQGGAFAAAARGRAALKGPGG